MSVHEPIAEKTTSVAAQWLSKHGDSLYAYAMSRVKNAETAEELVQETLVSALESHHRFEGKSSERTWLVGILRHKLLEYYRSRRGAPASLDIDGELPARVVDQEFTRKGRWNVGPKKWGCEFRSTEERDDFMRVLEGCLSKLPPRTAEVFTLAECEDVPVSKLQQALGISTANHVYVLLHRARSALRRCLERHWFGGSAKR